MVVSYISKPRSYSKNLDDILPTTVLVTGISGQVDQTSEGPKEDLELPFFDLATMANATDNFSLNNKVGEGGFGPVYKVNFQILRVLVGSIMA